MTKDKCPECGVPVFGRFIRDFSRGSKRMSRYEYLHVPRRGRSERCVVTTRFMGRG